MYRKLTPALAIAVTSVCAAAGLERPAKFASFEASPAGDTRVTYRFSGAASTSEDPVVIEAVDRSLNKADLPNRVTLQRTWIHRYVNREFKFLARWQVLDCGHKLKGTYAVCDAYVFSSPRDGKEHAYHIYIGNSPI